MSWKLIACDLDGTLIGRNSRPNARDVAALRRARDAGLHVAVCTGRNLNESRAVLEELGLTGPGIFSGGAEICEMGDGRPIARHAMDDALADDVIGLLGSMDLAVLVLGEDDGTGHAEYFYTDHGPVHPATMAWLRHNGLDQRPWPASAPRPRVVRVGVVVDSQHEADVTRVIDAKLGGRVNHHSLHSPGYRCHVIELFGPRVSKWSGIEQVCGMLGIGSEHAVAIGDDLNDLPMLKAARLSFAMGTASEHVRAHAKQVTGTQAECGVAQVVDGLLEGRW